MSFSRIIINLKNTGDQNMTIWNFVVVEPSYESGFIFRTKKNVWEGIVQTPLKAAQRENLERNHRCRDQKLPHLGPIQRYHRWRPPKPPADPQWRKNRIEIISKRELEYKIFQYLKMEISQLLTINQTEKKSQQNPI